MYKTGELYEMLAVPLSEFRANASAMIALVERGETVRILRHGKPVAELVPTKVAPSDAVPSWKRTIQCVQYQRPPAHTCAQQVSDEPAGAGS
ncbi:MAG: type II toxin-antitoxin system Phd/YefM family antitoxin [Burkholderiaceae bacterium]